MKPNDGSVGVGGGKIISESSRKSVSYPRVRSWEGSRILFKKRGQDGG